MSESQKWLERASGDLKDSAYNLKGKRFRTALFLAQQAAEKALKAVLIKKKGKFERIHDLVKLAKEAEAPESIISMTAALSPFYLQMRYPDAEFDETELSAAAANTLHNYAKEIIKWAKAEISR